MTAEIVPFPVGYHTGRQGPAGPLIDEIAEQEGQLKDLLENFPFGSEFDPRAGVSEETLTELAFALRMLSEANRFIEQCSDREAKYSLDNGWPGPDD